MGDSRNDSELYHSDVEISSTFSVPDSETPIQTAGPSQSKSVATDLHPMTTALTTNLIDSSKFVPKY